MSFRNSRSIILYYYHLVSNQKKTRLWDLQGRDVISGKGKAFGRTWEVIVLFAVVMGGLYMGIFTPTEAAESAPSAPSVSVLCAAK